DLARPRRAEQRPADLKKIIAQCGKLFAARSPAGVEVEARIEAELGWILTDDAMLRQVLDNLMSNALDALGEGGGRLSITASIAERRLLIEVADTGPGIPPDLLTRVFEPFYTTKEVGKGSGLGLSISATLAENLGGTLTAHSEEGVGSRFLLWLPHRPLAEDFQFEAE
ncbi:MAG TPA: ATP-binding protein, partial [Pyrinomonadaceae bacterium]|nr:ATP-binding protein [Pyrinomonadaceae bacterium]